MAFELDWFDYQPVTSNDPDLPLYLYISLVHLCYE